MKNIIKKIFPAITCLVSFNAYAELVNLNPDSNNNVNLDSELSAVDNTYVVTGGKSLVVNGGGINVANNVYVGQDYQGSDAGYLYVASDTQPVFSIQTTGNISVGGDLTVAEEKALNISAVSGSESSVDVNITGDVDALGSLNIAKINNFSAKNITAQKGLSITAGQNITATGKIDLNGEGASYALNFANDGDLTVASLENSGVLSVSGGNIASGTIQNTTTGTVTIDLSGDMNLTAGVGAGNEGNLWNSGASMNIKANGDVSVAGTVANDGQGLFIVNANSFSVNGGAGADRSFVNNGNVVINVAENTHIENGFDLSGMSIDNTFDLQTGTLTFGDGMDLDTALQLFSNKLNSFRLYVNNGDIEVNQIINGQAGQDSNPNAVMDLKAQNIAIADDVMNSGLQMTINGTATSGNAVDIAGDVIAGGNVQPTGEYNNKIVSGAGIKIGGTLNNSALTVLAGSTIDLGAITNNNGNLYISADSSLESEPGNAPAGAQSIVIHNNLVNNAGDVGLWANNFQLDGNLIVHDGTVEMFSADENGAADIAGIEVSDGSVAVTAKNSVLGNINQTGGSIAFYTSNVTVGDIIASDLLFKSVDNFPDGGLVVDVAGGISGGTDFIGLNQLDVAGNYTFDSNSKISANIASPETASRNYWASVSLNDDASLGQITNAENGQALITVGGDFIYDVPTSDNGFKIPSSGNNGAGFALQDNQIGINITSTVDQGSAIWLLESKGDKGIIELAEKIRNLNVNFCNADGSLCFNYLDSVKPENASDQDLPAYITVKDTDGDGVADSLYVVFDPRFGGPVEVFKIQPIVAKVPDHTAGELMSAGALDELIAGQMINTKFYNDTPIEVIPFMFQNTIFSEMAQELYNRLEYYNIQPSADESLARFSRLFQPREIEQLAGSIALEEHTNFRNFEDRMLDEFIWNRNRSLKKAWLDVDFGFFNQKLSDNKRVDGDRFSVSGGFDWQDSETLILGLTGRISHNSASNFDTVDLSYADKVQFGRVDIDVANTDIGLGGYLMKTLGEKTRLYGNAFLDIHVLDVDRQQNFMGSIEGNGTAFSLISEWGLLHDWLNQYVVGNAYARIGYNTGFSVKEKVAGQDYMELKSDGYMVLTPGYSLTAQKRIYPSVWFQIRPYATIGVEYDVLGTPDFAKYKFAPAHNYTKYDIDLDPLWANIGAGVEMISAYGVQVGLDYRYQYNPTIQVHNIKVSGSYRF